MLEVKFRKGCSVFFEYVLFIHENVQAGMSYIFIRRMIVVLSIDYRKAFITLTTRNNTSPSYAYEFFNRINVTYTMCFRFPTTDVMTRYT